MVTTLKRFGGLGIYEARLTNLALLGKLVWNMLHNKDKLWVKVLSQKYMGNTSLWMSKKHNKPSIIWRGIQHAITNDGGGPTNFVLSCQNYHRMGSMMPVSDSTPKFVQPYIYDTQNESKNRYKHFRYNIV